MHLEQQLIDIVSRNHNTLGFALLLLSACIEYLFPPFPGDMITVFGAFLVARRGWSGPLVFGAVLLGSAIGCMADYAFGRWLGRTEERWTRGRLRRFRPQIDHLVERFGRHGSLYLAINRFIPSLRGLFFVAAGMARLRWWAVLAFGTLSALLWNALLLGLGLTVGGSWDRLLGAFRAYGLVLWSAVALALVAVAVRWLWRRSRQVAGPPD
jgi:membrane protein DedA with SNARE-associated domain